MLKRILNFFKGHRTPSLVIQGKKAFIEREKLLYALQRHQEERFFKVLKHCLYIKPPVALEMLLAHRQTAWADRLFRSLPVGDIEEAMVIAVASQDKHALTSFLSILNAHRIYGSALEEAAERGQLETVNGILYNSTMELSLPMAFLRACESNQTAVMKRLKPKVDMRDVLENISLIGYENLVAFQAEEQALSQQQELHRSTTPIVNEKTPRRL